MVVHNRHFSQYYYAFICSLGTFLCRDLELAVPAAASYDWGKLRSGSSRRAEEGLGDDEKEDHTMHFPFRSSLAYASAAT